MLCLFCDFHLRTFMLFSQCITERTDVTATNLGLGCFRTPPIWFSGPPLFSTSFLKNFPPNVGLRSSKPPTRQNPSVSCPFLKGSWNSKWCVRKYTAANATVQFFHKSVRLCLHDFFHYSCLHDLMTDLLIISYCRHLSPTVIAQLEVFSNSRCDQLIPTWLLMGILADSLVLLTRKLSRCFLQQTNQSFHLCSPNAGLPVFEGFRGSC